MRDGVCRNACCCVCRRVATPTPGKWLPVLDSDGLCFGGEGRVAWSSEHFTEPSKDKFHDRCDDAVGVVWCDFIASMTSQQLTHRRPRRSSMIGCVPVHDSCTCVYERCVGNRRSRAVVDWEA
jgi:hypothetical protein